MAAAYRWIGRLHFNMMQNAVKIVFSQNLCLMFVKNLQHQLVEKNPAAPEKLVEKVSHLLKGYHAAKQAKNPLRSEHFCLYVVSVKVLMDVRQVNRQQSLDHLAVLVQPWQSRRINIPHITIFNQCYEEPKRHSLRAVDQKTADDKVHALHVVY
jgi:hypothetical protein